MLLKKRKVKIRKIKFSILFLILINQACSLQSDNIAYQKAESYYKDNNLKKAVENYQNVIRLKPNSEKAVIAAKKAARILHFELSDFEKAIQIYKFLILKTTSKPEVKKYQELITSIYYNKLIDYNKSIIEYYKLLKIESNQKNRNQIQLKIIKAHFNLNQFYQSLIEIGKILKQENLQPYLEFQILSFKANIHLTTKKYTKALDIYKILLKKFPTISQKENVGIAMAICYEEMSELDMAINILNEVKEKYASPDFIELKIKRLEGRKKNLPGAKGFLR